MEPDNWPLDAAVAAERVRNVINDLDNSSEEDNLALLSELLSAAWGSVAAQNQ